MTLESRSREKHGLNRPFDELNLARLSLISMQSRVSRDAHSWEDAYPEGGQQVSVKCVGTLQYLVPHGNDNDVMIGIQNMFLAAGCPEGNAVTDTANGFLRWAGLDTSGRYHRYLKDSLMRLSHTNYHIERGWYTGKRFQTVIFRHLHEITFDSAEAGGGLDRESRITVVLPAAIAESLRRGFIKPLDAQVLAVLEQPPTRALYRLLDGSRYDPSRPGERVDILQLNLVAWGRRARILDLRPNKIRRTLEGAHEELISARYLTGVDYSGRGVNTNITYTFAHDIESDDPQLYDRLTLHGISPKMTRELIGQLGNALVRERLDEAETLSQGKRRPGPGFFVAFIRAPEDYRARFPALSAGQAGGEQPGEPEAPKVSAAARRAGTAQAINQPLLLSLPRVTEPDPEELARERWEGLTPAERIKDTLRMLKVTYGARLTGGQYEMVREALEVGALPLELVRSAAARALAESTRDESVAQLRQQLYELNQP